MAYIKLINPATNRPFNEVRPDSRIIQLRTEILRALRGKYDAAQSTHQNQGHWNWADHLSPSSANSLPVRKLLRERSRYEVANNGYLLGIALTLANDFVGSGPTLQITDERFNDDQRTLIEKAYAKYCKKIKLRRKLWRLRFAKLQDGEAFKFQIRNPRMNYPIQYDYRIFECDQVSSLTPPQLLKDGSTRLEIDGIRFDKVTGEPISYFLLDEHPGEIELWTMESMFHGQWIPARQVTHWFRQERSWLRGIPETTATLPLWALLRRYTLAVVQNAEIAADFTVLLKSMQPAATSPFPLDSSGQPTASDPQDWFSSFPVDRGLMTVLPDMYDLEQLDPAQPVTMYDAFVNALVQEATRPLLAPRNLALGNSGNYNMASGALDRQYYKQAVNQERLDCSEVVLDPCFESYWFEAVRIPEYFDEAYATTSPIHEVIYRYPSLYREPPEHSHRWDEVPEHSDPVKVATALDILHKGGHLSDTDIQEQRFNRSVDQHYKNLERQYDWHRKNKSPDKELEEKSIMVKKTNGITRTKRSNGKPNGTVRPT